MCLGSNSKKGRFFKAKVRKSCWKGGKKKALVAVGHKIIVAVYHVIKKKEAYKEPKLHENPKKQNKRIRNYINRLKELGVEVGVLEDKIQEGRFFTELQKVRE